MKHHDGIKSINKVDGKAKKRYHRAIRNAGKKIVREATNGR